MKKLTLTAIGVAIVLVGFIAILYCLPCKGECCGHRDRCEMRDGKCPGERGECKDEDDKCMGHGDACEHGKENCQEKEWTDADGKCHKEVRVTIGGEGDEMGGCNMPGNGTCQMQMGNGGSCNMQMENHGCCCCCCCMMMMNGCHMGDSMKMDSSKMKVKVRGKL